MPKKLKDLEKRLKKQLSFAVAFSGGVDSTFLLAVAKKVNPQNLLAITVSSQFVPGRETAFAKNIARSLGVKHICLDVDILGNEDVAGNTLERCYHCKKQMFSLIQETAGNLGIKSLLHAVNLDDLKDFRPGLKAAEELGFISPLVDARYTKADIRLFSKQLGLETWNKPSQSCLATRIPYDETIKAGKLIMVDKAESFIQDLGFAQVRVRCHGKIARIEVEPWLIDSLLNSDIRQKISKEFQKIGFEHISVDIDGYKAAAGKLK
ncbi:MAG: ATP-dependent sacrificial sulfur transferase LarE [Desulfobacula sp.]|uniref:ATP-dependent sacrificial sulfur transferase LarE n=1 Tax=Desulfobacula sp. TaxID=2593537 RepID=UPI0025C70099|nr:ATP-dependent sacrificial sulfur transferase LarE [Desulfobacula sp.]MCD4719778.1 ATP-dependent sacrificial sulfur transferase LarE [Desulfobacula sp.]